MIFRFAPAGIEGLFREMGELSERGFTWGGMVEIGERYGVTYFQPTE